MYTGRQVFSQLMDFLPRRQFHRCVNRYHSDHYTKSFSSLAQFLCMSFAQLSYRESLRDIEACLHAMQNKLYHMGIRTKVSRSTFADANENRDWRIYADFAQVLIHIARDLYAMRTSGLNLMRLYNASTINLNLSLFPWPRFRKPKGVVKLHTLLHLRKCIPTFISITYKDS
jgi:hypothetical protein